MFHWKHGGGREAGRKFFLIFVWYPQAFVFFGLQTLCFLVYGGWLNFVYCLLKNLSFTTVLSRFEINSFDTANN